MMLNVTNRKISTFDVRWAPFPGFTILFNNGEDHSLEEHHSDIVHLVNDIHNDSALNFYKQIDECMMNLNSDSSLAKNYLFGALPSSTYHVTLWSGLNIRTVNNINPEYRSMTEKWLSTLSNSFSVDIPQDLIEYPSMSSLCTNRNRNINFQFDQLKIWHNSVLVITLRPHLNSKLVFDQLCEDRCQLNKQYHNRFHVFTDSEGYKPHISLGYFANEEGAQKAFEHLNQWNTLFNNTLQDNILSFNNANIYSFTDMIHFFKVQHK